MSNTLCILCPTLYINKNLYVCIYLYITVKLLVTQSCLTLCDTMDGSLPSSSVHGDSPRKNTGVGCHVLLQGFFPTQGSNPGLLHFRQILDRLSHQGSPRITGVGSLSLFQGIFLTQESNWGLPHCTQILYQLRYQGSLKKNAYGG